MNHPASYKNRRVVVLGMAKSGFSVASLFCRYGANVVVNDKKDRDQCPEADELERLGATVICGGHPDDLITPDTALLVKNPGIPYRVPPVAKAAELGVETVTEIEVAYHLSPAPIIGITGSNAKTTTTTWVGQLLEAAGMNPIVAGNIGRPLCDAAQEAAADNWLVAELSSFQLKGTASFRPRVAALLNIAETHLDYHGDMDDYIASKIKLFANQTEGDWAVLNWDDPVCRQVAQSVRSQVLPFSIRERLERGLFAEPPYPADGAAPEAEGHAPVRTIVWRDGRGGETTLLREEELGVPGAHNTANALAAAAICIAAGVSPEQLSGPMRSLRAVEHRLEFVRERNGVKYFNDSKATNWAATANALRSFRGGVVLIAGGLDRGSDYMELLPVLRERAKALVALGETRGKLARVAELAGLAAIKIVEPEKDAESTLRKAVREAALLAEPGDTVLLSPSCASWDMFASYEERGRIFKDSAHNL
ncbi:UDP-N-acetylmuramoylalanine--D-glutamate ligase [Paenibacillus sp. 32O-W]|uniref:UDP-N-acetylmuramoyl-L-alanine--D-glutamate ligase n=1 Tax=Paenibacillus sp. 32O-W TaxID=1695218 RepID=UPI000722E9B1|nr:UDP-N-acetylmuramoyl-L-alanine--D-glutamate ligase [Paenibacillus sp. 32O-W]ALS27352.1 UDP-N-acetylmuramoylalanine--D-glutamate ligase [Paenibacillus sp. 32O-W]